jgi:hypothetical protein
MPHRIPMKVWLLVFIALVIANVAIYRTLYATPVLEIHVFHVGSPVSGGNAILVHTPRNKTLLIDTGSDASIVRALGGTLPMWQRCIDALVFTSTDAKSTGGLPAISNRYTIPTPLRFGIQIPYGSSLTFDTDTHITIIAPHTITISYGATSFAFSSSTPSGIYRTDGTSVQK